MGPLTLGTVETAQATVQQDPSDGTKAQIAITLPAGVLGVDPVTLPPMDLSQAEVAQIIGWGVRFLVENSGMMPAPVLRAIADAMEAT